MWVAGKPKDIINEGRGRIIPVCDGEFKTVMIIETRKGGVRANHWHKTDSHVMYILSGRMRYIEENHGIREEKVYGPGDSVITLPGIPHAAEFLEDTVMIVAAKNERDTETYLDEIVKCKLI